MNKQAFRDIASRMGVTVKYSGKLKAFFVHGTIHQWNVLALKASESRAAFAVKQHSSSISTGM